VTFIVILLASFICTVAMPVGKVEALALKIYVDPPQIINETMITNTIFNISVKVDNIPADPGAVGIQFFLTWNSSVLNAVSMEEVVFHQTVPEDKLDNLNRLAHKVTVANASYAYTYYDILLAISDGYAPLSGNFTVAIIKMKVVGAGKCAIHFTDSIIGDPNANDIPHDAVDGFFNNLAPPPPPKAALLYVDPANVINASLTPGNNFTININIINASGLGGLEFKLGFNVSVLNANSVAKGGFIPGSVTPTTQIDNTGGFVKFNVSLSTPLDGDGTVAVVEFQVEAGNVRNSTLHLYDVTLVDGSGQPLLVNTIDGSFTNSRTIAGDLNQDDTVDIKDAIVAGNSYGSSLGDPRWNPDADLYPDGKINILDVIVLASHFGQSI